MHIIANRMFLTCFSPSSLRSLNKKCCCAAETKNYINCKFRKEWVSDFRVKDRSCGYHLNHGNNCEYDDPEDKDDDTIDPTPQSLLNCSAHNGPYDYESVEEMVYWKDIPADANYRSKFAPNNNLNDRYLTFETDLSGFNNQRMVFEINVITAIVTGRTLVMPRDRNLEHHVETKKVAMDDFFDLYGIAREIPHIFKLMTIDEFIAREGTPDKLNFPSNFTDFYPRVRGRWRSYEDPITKEKSVDVNLTGVDNYHDKFLLEHYEQVFCSVPKLGKEVCSNYTDWIEQRHKVFYENLNFKFWRYDLDVYLAGHPDVAHPSWGSSRAILTIPNRTGDHAHDSSEQTKRFRSWTNWTRDSILKFKGNPAAVNAPPSERLQEIYQNREGLAVYDAAINAMKYFHQVDTPKDEERLLGHFYDYIFFEDWKEDLWVKRFIRDKLRYTDQIQCAAAKIVAALREIANELHSKGGIYHAMHVRKGDLAKMYKNYGVDVNASGIFETVSIRRNIIPKSGIVYIATDEKDKTFFDSFVQNYKAVYFLDDFLGLLGPDFPSEYYGMVEQLVCSRAENFVGTFYSTFTAYINRLRGYHSQKHRPNVAASQDNTSRGRADKEADLQKKRLAREQGVISSWYFAPQEKIDVYQNYEAIGANNIFAMEFPIAWRNIDFDVDEELRATLDRDVVVAETVARNEVRMAMGMNNFSQVNKHDDDNFGKDGNNCNDQNEHNVTAGKHVRCSIN